MWKTGKRVRKKKQRSGQSVDVAHARHDEQSSTGLFKAKEKVSTCEGSCRFRNELRLAAAKDAALRVEAAEGHDKCDDVLKQKKILLKQRRQWWEIWHRRHVSASQWWNLHAVSKDMTTR